jgi:hypothetical protein
MNVNRDVYPACGAGEGRPIRFVAINSLAAVWLMLLRASVVMIAWVSRKLVPRKNS